MKIITVNGKKLVTILALIISAVLIGIWLFASLSTASEHISRKLPIYSVDTPDKSVAITFDDAWNDDDIDDIIKILDRYNCAGTFFVVGKWADKYPESVKKLANAGHEIANHSDSHAHYAQMSENEICADMEKCNLKIKKLTGTEPTLVRAPYGEYNDDVLKCCEKTGKFCIQWSIDSLDWKGLSADEMKKRILPNLQNGSIILFHNGTENTAAALPDILQEIQKSGYSFKKCSELIYKDNYEIDISGRQIPKETMPSS